MQDNSVIFDTILTIKAKRESDVPARVTTRLPSEIWILVAERLTIREIETLGSTCHFIRTLLICCLSLWRDVIQDLLVVSPSIVLSHSLDSATAETLRSKAIQFCKNDRMFLSHKRVRSATKLPLASAASHYGVQIVPGIDCVAYVTTSLSVHLMSLVSGKDIHVWQPPVVTPTTGELFIYPSATYGHIAVVVVGYKTPQADKLISATWLFQIDTKAELRLIPLLFHEEDIFPGYVSIAYDTVALAWSTRYRRPTIVTIDITSSSSTTCAPTKCWVLPQSVIEHIEAMELLTHDTVIIVIDSGIVLTRLPEDSLPVCCRIIPLPGSDIALGIRYEGFGRNEDLCVVIASGLHEYYTLRARHIDLPAVVSVVPQEGILRELGMSAFMDGDNEAGLTRLATQSVVPYQEVAWRLGDSQSPLNELETSVIYGGQLDEWVGVGIIPSMLAETGLCESITVIRP